MSKKKKNKANRSPQTKTTNVPKPENNIEQTKNSVPEENVEEIHDSKPDLAEEKTVPVEENTEDNTSEEKTVPENSEDNTAEEKTVPENSEDNTPEEKTVSAEENAKAELQKVPDRNAEKLKSVKKQRFYFAFAIVVFLFAAIGVVSSVVFAVNSIKSSISTDPLKDEFTKFLLPVTANDIAPFENLDELSNYSKINCSIWNILLNHDTSSYNLSETGEFIISEYDVEFSCKELFGSSEGISHRTVGATDMSFVYDSDKHVYTCRKDLRYLNYVPVITDMSESGGVYTLTVEYYLPALLFLSNNMGLETEAEKTMKYIVDHNEGKNTLIAVQFTSEEIY